MPHFLCTFTPCRPDFILTMTDTEKMAMFAHAQYLMRLHGEGKLVLAGPCMDGSQAIYVLMADSLQAAAEIVAADPAVTGQLVTHRLQAFHLSFLQGQAPNLLGA